MNADQLMTAVKLALEYNAAIIAQASLIIGQDLKPQEHEKLADWFRKTGMEYAGKLDKLFEKPPVQSEITIDSLFKFVKENDVKYEEESTPDYRESCREKHQHMPGVCENIGNTEKILIGFDITRIYKWQDDSKTHFMVKTNMRTDAERKPIADEIPIDYAMQSGL